MLPDRVLLAKRPVDDGEVWYWQVRSDENLWLIGLRCDEVSQLLDHWSGTYPASQLPQWLRVRGVGAETEGPPPSRWTRHPLGSCSNKVCVSGHTTHGITRRHTPS